jgi:hypothetical protein
METKTTYQVLTSENDGILEVIITGKVTGSDVKKLQQEMQKFRDTFGDKLLVNLQAVNDGLGYGETLYYVRRPARPTGKVAIVDLPAHEKYKQFFETAVPNTEMKVKWFTDIDQARAWLRHQEKDVPAFKL